MVQDVREVWFKGEHSDVGGGSAGPEGTPPNVNYSMLSNITLRWMIRQILETKIGILFDHIAIERYRTRKILETPPKEGLQPSKDWMKRLAESIKLDREDIKHGIYDSIGWSPLWNGLEYVALTAKPTKTKDFESTTTRWYVSTCTNCRLVLNRSYLGRMPKSRDRYSLRTRNTQSLFTVRLWIILCH
jgi:hypothetical protein